MRFKMLLVFLIGVSELFFVTHCLMASCNNLRKHLFETTNITSFIDDNRYIRLNISWEHPTANFTSFDMMIDTNCSALYGERNISINQKYVIQPDLDRLQHPAEPILHGCKYLFEFYTDIIYQNENCNLKQFTNYEIPECVETVCECGATNSPYKLMDIEHLENDLYEIRFNKTNLNIGLDLESVFNKIYYKNTESNTLSYVYGTDVDFDNEENKFILPFNNFHHGKSYVIYIDLLLDNCEYHFYRNVEVPDNYEQIIQYIFYMGILFICISILSFIYMKHKLEFLNKLKKCLPFFVTTTDLPGVVAIQSVKDFSGRDKIIINTQYTPLEFDINTSKFDKYEIPRTRIILNNEIGSGAFGKVYKAQLYGYNDNAGFILVAAKVPIENSPPDEIRDFLTEIKTMKKIVDSGGHKNVIQILGCVTIDMPFIMIMELAPCGSLKTYLTILREEWESRKERMMGHRHNRHFFPDNMIIENYLPLSEREDIVGNTLKYAKLDVRHNSLEEINSSDSFTTPVTSRSSPNSPPYITPKLPKSNLIKAKKPNLLKHFTPVCLNNSCSPSTPESLASSKLPSTAATTLTPLESPNSPLLYISEEEEYPRPALDSKELQNFAMQIASGMTYLESIQVTHRDLATRNILMNQDRVLKISDFGLAREGVYVNSKQKKQPLRWMAPEAIENRRYDNKTDVWSFGVVLWEIGSLGAFPYKNLSNDLVIPHILTGNRLERPITCTDQLYELMQRCWKHDPNDRPAFNEILKQLKSNSGKIYVNFKDISPKYVFPPKQDSNSE